MSDSAPTLRRPAITALDVHVGAVIVCGLTAVGAAFYTLVSAPPAPNDLVFAGLGLIAGLCAVRIPRMAARVAASGPVFLASAVMVGPPSAMAGLAINSALLSVRRSYSVQRLLFNATATPLSLGIATWIFQLLGGAPPGSSPVHGIIPVAALTIAYFVLNSGLLAGAISLE